MVVRQNWPLRGDPEGGFGFQGPSVCACGFSDWWGGEEEEELQKGNAQDAFRTLSAPQSMRKLRVNY